MGAAGGTKTCFPGLRNSLVWLGGEIGSSDVRYMRGWEIMKVTGEEERSRRFVKKIGISFLCSSTAPSGQTLVKAKANRKNSFPSERGPKPSILDSAY